MNSAMPKQDTHAIVVEEIIPHPPEAIWRLLTTGALMARWIMAPSGFEPVVGCTFTFQTTPAGLWDGVIHCEVLDVRPNERFSHTWVGGHDSNAGYGSKLDTVVTWSLTPVAGGTRLRLVHSGFRLPTNHVAFDNLGKGWKTVLPRLGAATADVARADRTPTDPVEGEPE